MSNPDQNRPIYSETQDVPALIEWLCKVDPWQEPGMTEDAAHEAADALAALTEEVAALRQGRDDLKTTLEWYAETLPNARFRHRARVTLAAVK